MKLTLDPKTLAPALQRLAPFVPKKPSHPVLVNVRIEATAEGATLTATDLSRTLEVQLGAVVDEPGAIALPHDLLSQLAGRLGQAPVDLEAVPGGPVTLTAGSGRYELAGVDPEQFPDPPAAEVLPVEVPVAPLQAAIAHCAGFVGADDARPVLTGLQLQLEGDTLRAAATDGRRLAWFEVEAPAAGARLSTLLHPTPLRQFLRCCEGSVRVCCGAGLVLFISPGGDRLALRPINGVYPNWPQLLPAAYPAGAVGVDRSALLAALGRIQAVLQAGQSDCCRLSLSPGQLELSAIAQDRGSGRETLAVEFEGDLQIGFNGQFLAQALRALEGDRVAIALTHERGPAVLTGSGPGRVLVMPMQLEKQQ